jgi:hypothetical protein
LPPNTRTSNPRPSVLRSLPEVPSDNSRYLSAASTAHAEVLGPLLPSAAPHARARQDRDFMDLHIFRRLRLKQPMAHQPPSERGRVAPNLAGDDMIRHVTHNYDLIKKVVIIFKKNLIFKLKNTSYKFMCYLIFKNIRQNKSLISRKTSKIHPSSAKI